MARAFTRLLGSVAISRGIYVLLQHCSSDLSSSLEDIAIVSEQYEAAGRGLRAQWVVGALQHAKTSFREMMWLELGESVGNRCI